MEANNVPAITIAVSSHLCVICHHFSCLVLLFQGYVVCQNFNLTGSHPSSETQGQSVGLGGATKVFKHRRKSPWYRFSPDHFQTVKQMLAPGWAPKMLCIIVPNWQTASPDFFSWVCTEWLLSHHTCPVCSPRLCVQLTDCPFVSEDGSHHLLD